MPWAKGVHAFGSVPGSDRARRCEVEDKAGRHVRVFYFKIISLFSLLYNSRNKSGVQR